jgi:hypothetical protein
VALAVTPVKSEHHHDQQILAEEILTEIQTGSHDQQILKVQGLHASLMANKQQQPISPNLPPPSLPTTSSSSTALPSTPSPLKSETAPTPTYSSNPCKDIRLLAGSGSASSGSATPAPAKAPPPRWKDLPPDFPENMPAPAIAPQRRKVSRDASPRFPKTSAPRLTPAPGKISDTPYTAAPPIENLKLTECPNTDKWDAPYRQEATYMQIQQFGGPYRMGGWIIVANRSQAESRQFHISNAITLGNILVGTE